MEYTKQQIWASATAGVLISKAREMLRQADTNLKLAGFSGIDFEGEGALEEAIEALDIAAGWVETLECGIHNDLCKDGQES